MTVLPQLHSPFRPPALSPRVASVVNTLLPLVADGTLPWPGNRVALRVCPFPQPFAAGIRATLRWFGGVWQAEAGRVDVVRVHPLLKDLPPEAAVPGALRLAALDMLVHTALETLSTLGGSPQSLEHAVVAPDPFPNALSDAEEAAEESAPFLWLELVLPDGARFPLRLRLPEEDAPVQALLSALATEAALTRLPESQKTFEFEVSVAVETGAMRLSTEQCRGLSVGDILLPDDYPARKNRVRLVFQAQHPMPVLHCTVCGLAATIDHLTLPPEASMTDSTPQEMQENSDIPENDTPEDTSSEEIFAEKTSTEAGNAVSVSDMDLAVSFELERRLMSVAEVAELRPGHTFTLTADPLSPVTLRVQGKAIGTGRLVDLGGVLGVQITAVS